MKVNAVKVSMIIARRMKTMSEKRYVIKIGALHVDLTIKEIREAFGTLALFLARYRKNITLSKR